MGENNTLTPLKGCGVKITIPRVLLHKRKRNRFCTAKQSVPMSINQFVEMTVFLCLIWFFSIYDKMQGFLDESGLFIFLFIYFCVLCRNSKWPQKVAGKRFLGKSSVDSADNLWVKNFMEIALSRSISEINRFLRFTQKFKMAAKSGGKTIFVKKCQLTLQIPCGPKILLKSLYLAPFPR